MSSVVHLIVRVFRIETKGDPSTEAKNLERKRKRDRGVEYAQKRDDKEKEIEGRSLL